MIDTGYIYTYTGKKFYPLEPNSNDIDIVDISHALSMICRFTGHTNRFYSVAHHSYLVSLIAHNIQAPKTSRFERLNLAFEGLMHDATEAYVMDLARPVKHQIPEYIVIENNLYSVIAEKFLLPPTISKTIKEIDSRILINERDILINPYADKDFAKQNKWESEDRYPAYGLNGIAMERSTKNLITNFINGDIPSSLIEEMFCKRFYYLVEELTKEANRER